MSKNDKDNPAGELTFPSISAALTVLGSVLGVVGFPAIGAGAASTGATLSLAQRLKDRRARREAERFKLILENVQKRVSLLEEREYSEDEVDLFIEVVSRAIKDDEDDKELIYSAVLEWIIRDRPKLVQVRILADGVRQLSYLELYCFLMECQGSSSRELHEKSLSENLLWNRLAHTGLSQGATVRMKGSPTDIGSILVRYCKLEELPKPE